MDEFVGLLGLYEGARKEGERNLAERLTSPPAVEAGARVTAEAPLADSCPVLFAEMDPEIQNWWRAAFCLGIEAAIKAEGGGE